MTEQHDDGMTIQIGERSELFRPPVLSRDLSRMPADKLPEAVYDLQDWIAKYCGFLAEALYFDPKLQEKLFARLQAARRDIAEAESKDPLNLVVTLNKVIFEVHRIHARISKEQKFLEQRKRLQWISVIVVVVYIAIIIGIIVLGEESKASLEEMPVIGIPRSVLLWSLIGSVAAILYRFYTFRISELSQVYPEISWLIARPLTGIIMGMVSYLGIVAGLFVFGAAPGSPATRLQLLSVVAFLAGFSDKFFEGFVRTLLSLFSGAAPESPPKRDDA